MDRDDEGMLPLFAAATVAYGRVFSTRGGNDAAPSVDELDLVAPAARISDDELSQGMFWGGGMRFELSDGSTTTITKLAVRRGEFERVLAELKKSPLEL